MRAKTFLRIWQVSAVLWLIIWTFLFPAEWDVTIILAPVIGLIVAAMAQGISNLLQKFGDNGWEVFLEPSNYEPNPYPLWYRILRKFFR